MRVAVWIWAALVLAGVGRGGTVTIEPGEKFQRIDGFGTCVGGKFADSEWYRRMYLEDMECSIARMDISPHFCAPYSDLSYYSPWFMGSGTRSVFNLEDKANPGGAEGNRVRTYTGPEDYSRVFGGKRAPIAVMGADIEKNIRFFDYKGVEGCGKLAQAGEARKGVLGDFKLIGSMWSPAPWVKVSSGNKIGDGKWPGPVGGTAWPFIWGGNSAGGMLDVSDRPLEVFNDGTGATSALTQFARGTAAYLKGFQDRYKVRFWGISIQNELNFEEFYGSCTYPTAGQYIKALKAVRRELDRHADLRGIRILGPEDLLGGDAYGMWQYGGKGRVVHKNLQYLAEIVGDAEALKALEVVCIHGYAADGATASGAEPKLWEWWVNGWTKSPAAGLPSDVKGFASLGKSSWVTETSGEGAGWLEPAEGFPGKGAWSVALKIQQALTVGRQSAYVYWQFADKEKVTTVQGLTRKVEGEKEPKYIAAKHFYKFIRPGAVAVGAKSDDGGILSSAFINTDGSAVVVLVNRTGEDRTVLIRGVEGRKWEGVSSCKSAQWEGVKDLPNNREVSVVVRGYSVLTVVGK